MQQHHQEEEENQHNAGAEGYAQKEAIRIEELENHGVNKTDITKLKNGGFHTIQSLAHNSVRRLTDVKGMSEAKVLKIKEIIKTNKLVPMGK